MSHRLTTQFGKKLRGVNLGGWLVLEKWITPSLFEGLEAKDETSFCVELGAEAESRLKSHWDTFITRDDFAWLAKRGINAVRIPVGHWLFGPDYPYHRSYGSVSYPFVVGGIDIVDRAFTWAEEYGLHIVLDLHAAPGCQNGFDNGGIKDVCEWHTSKAYVNHSLSVLERLAERYSGHPALHGIETLNEPRWDIDTSLLKKYHTDAYHRIRKYCQPEDVAVVFHDGFRSHGEYIGFLQEPEFSNVVFDIHRYQCFVREDIDMDIYGHLQKAAIDWKNEADNIIQNLELPTYCGEWSLGLDLKVVSLWAEGPFNHALDDMDEFQMSLAYRGYAAAELLTFEKYLGWFFWNYKTETTPAWCFRECVRRGWIPDLSKREMFDDLREEILRGNQH
ncbi:MAG: glycoside hydrolase family 5 protein [Methylococcaceae bacterium]